jgi:hypothetical protein
VISDAHVQLDSLNDAESSTSRRPPSEECVLNDASGELDTKLRHHNAQVHIETPESMVVADAQLLELPNLPTQLGGQTEPLKRGIHPQTWNNSSVCHTCSGRIIRTSRALSLGVLPEEVIRKTDGDYTPNTPMQSVSPPHTPANSPNESGIKSHEFLCRCVKRRVSVSVTLCISLRKHLSLY